MTLNSLAIFSTASRSSAASTSPSASSGRPSCSTRRRPFGTQHTPRAAGQRGDVSRHGGSSQNGGPSSSTAAAAIDATTRFGKASKYSFLCGPSIVSADQAAARADRQTEGVRTADQALEAARAKRDEACGRGLGKTVACQSRQAEVAKLEAKQTQVSNKVFAQAKPESADFVKLVAWLSNGALQPGADDFDMLWLFFRMFLPQVGGLVLMLARR
jgi:hypothetical protein